MALVKCRECGHEIAASAAACPNCGVKYPARAPSKNFGKLLVVLIVLLVVIVLVTDTPSTSLTSSSSNCLGSSPPIHGRMAALEEGHSCPSELTINRFRTLLQRIAPRCAGETPTSVADKIVVARGLIRDRGIDEGYLQITEILDQTTAGKAGLNCAEILALYSVSK